jgi:hypothetical protein
MYRRSLCVFTVLLGATMFLAVLPPANLQAQSEQRCFAETGFCIEGRIREFWEQNGGLPVFGLPTSPQQEEQIEGQAFQIQWFERNRLELHPENPRPYDVLLGRLGVDRLSQIGIDWRQFPQSEPAQGCRFFPETGHNICGAFLQVWRANGLEFDGSRGKSEVENLTLFGLPLSDARTETIAGQEYTVQWFERARFELHPENQPPYDVLLGLLGNETRGFGEIRSPLHDVFAQVGDGEPFDFVNQPGTLDIQLTGADACRRSGQYGLRLTYGFTEDGNGGWGVAWNNAPGGSFDASPFDVLSFWVRGTAPNGFQIGLRDTNEREVKIESRDVVTVSPDEWRKANIPLSKFADANGVVDPARVSNMNIGFNASHGSGSICIADIAFEASLADIFPQVGGSQTFEFFNPPSSFSAQFVEDQACRHTGQYGLRIDYSFTGDGFGGWGVQWSNAPGGSLDASRFNTLTFWVKGTAPQGFDIGLKDTNEREVKVGVEPAQIADNDWQKVMMSLSRFADGGGPVNTAAVRNLNVGFNASHGTGFICIDEIALE